MELRELVKRAGRRAGVEMTSWPLGAPAYALYRALVEPDPDVIIDGGANTGQFARECRAFGYDKHIISFEPGREAYAHLQRTARDDPRWSTARMALSNEAGTATLFTTDNGGLSSSLVPMLDSHRRAAPEVHVTGREDVAVTTLDESVADTPHRRIALKLDTQGTEAAILDGARATLPRIHSIRLECSLLPLYEDEWLWHDVGVWMQDHGFRLAGVAPGFASRQTGVQQQIDAVFVRNRDTGD